MTHVTWPKSRIESTFSVNGHRGRRHHRKTQNTQSSLNMGNSSFLVTPKVLVTFYTACATASASWNVGQLSRCPFQSSNDKKTSSVHLLISSVIHNASPAEQSMENPPSGGKSCVSSQFLQYMSSMSQSWFPKTQHIYLPCSNPIVHNCAQKMCPPGCNSLSLQAQAMLHVIALYCAHHLGSAFSTIFMDYV